ncbi:hypothetical protein ACP70R_003801 [Stipagrostis hirtigluma subsp. patula]
MDDKSWYISTDDAGDHDWRWMPGEPNKVFHSSYLLESRDELLWVFVQVKREYYNSVRRDHVGVVAGSLASALSVSVYALQEAEPDNAGEPPRWVKRDGRSLAGRVLFLGHPRSFTVDTVRLGAMGDGGFAYFVLTRWLGSVKLGRRRVYRYSFCDDTSELVEQLPAEWSDEACMWLTPQPAIAQTEEINGRIQASSNRKAPKPDQRQFGPYFRIYVGNLPWKVDSYRLRQFFSKHGKVADARVMCHRKTGLSRGFGFVTMATTVDDELADAVAQLHGQSLDGRPLRVRLADQEQ